MVSGLSWWDNKFISPVSSEAAVHRSVKRVMQPEKVRKDELLIPYEL